MGTNPEPVTVSVNDPPPAAAELGLMEVMDGEGLFTENSAGKDVPPPGAGLTTVKGNVPDEAMSEAAI